MKTGFNRITSIWRALLLVLMFTSGAFAEGTKQFMPASTNFGCIQVNDVGRPFALTTNTDPLQRLYFHISSTTEKVYFGFSRHSTSVASSGQYQIKNPSGTIVMGPSNIPNGGAGAIGSYAAAVAGPKIGGVPAGGYSPLTYTPVTTGDFYMEFSSANNDNYRFEFFDLTVVNSSSVPIDGRVWSYAWDLNTWAGSNAFAGSFYVYTSEGYVSKVNMNGIQPYGFVTSCNGTGPQNTGNLVVDRRSIDGNSTRPDFKVFLNNPDVTAYPSANAPTITDSIKITGGNVYYGQPVQFTIGVSAPGTMQFIISINGVSGYQAGTSDVLVVSNVIAGNNTINWDGKDAYGTYPAAGATIEISTGFSAGITHLPIYDPETHATGFVVDRVRPGTGSAPIRWDDSNFSGGTVNISGGSSSGHSWGTDFGDVRTMNTWWNGYEVENLGQFTVIVQTALPVELTNFNIEVNSFSNPVLYWQTVSESNLDYFILERSSALGTAFTKIGQEKAHGNSSVVKYYSFEDQLPLTGNSFYLLKAVTFDGNIVYTSRTEKIARENILSVFEILPNPFNEEFSVVISPLSGKAVINIYNILGENIISKESEGGEVKLGMEKFPKGIYYVKVFMEGKVLVKKVVKQY